MNDKLKSPQADILFKVVLNLKTTEECYEFFEDLCTVYELKEMSRRFEVAKMLKNKMSYAEIEAKTGLSSATISRVNRCLNYGSGGYQTALQRLEEDIPDGNS